MKYIKDLTDEQKESIADKIIYFINNNKPYNLYEQNISFYDEDNTYMIYRDITKDKELGYVILSNDKRDITLMFSLKKININKLAYIEQKLLPIINAQKINISDDEFADIFGVVPDLSIERSKKINKINNKIKDNIGKKIINKIKNIF